MLQRNYRVVRKEQISNDNYIFNKKTRTKHTTLFPASLSPTRNPPDNQWKSSTYPSLSPTRNKPHKQWRLIPLVMLQTSISLTCAQNKEARLQPYAAKNVYITETSIMNSYVESGVVETNQFTETSIHLKWLK